MPEAFDSDCRHIATESPRRSILHKLRRLFYRICRPKTRARTIAWGGINYRAAQVMHPHLHSFHLRFPKIGVSQFGPTQISARQFARPENRASQIRILKIGPVPVAPFEFASPKSSALELRVAHIAVLNQHVLPVQSRRAKASKPAIDEFHSHQNNAISMNIRKIATHEPNVLPYHRPELSAPELNVLEYRTLDSKTSNFQVSSF